MVRPVGGEQPPRENMPGESQPQPDGRNQGGQGRDAQEQLGRVPRPLEVKLSPQERTAVEPGHKIMPHRPWRIRIDESVPAEILAELGLSCALPRNQWLTVQAPRPETESGKTEGETNRTEKQK